MINFGSSMSLRNYLLCSIISFLLTPALAQPTITSFTPIFGPVGTAVTITGTGFNPIPADNIVIFGATSATVTAATSSQLTVNVPTGATYSPITVLNATTGLLAYTQSNFTPVFSPTKGSIKVTDFNPKVDFATGTNPSSVSLGDLDGDGKADMVVANYGSNTVSVYRNTGIQGTISYAAKVDFVVGSFPYSVSIGDLDGDGKEDLAVTNLGSNTISVFRNTSSSGTINFANKVDFTTGSNPISVSIGDLDGDGKADVAIANSSSNTVSTFRNTGGVGTLSFASKVDFTTGLQPYSVSIADLDGDGKSDLAVANNFYNFVSVLRNTGSVGTINYAAKEDFETGSAPISISIGDLDGDGKADLVVANYGSNTVSVLRSTGSVGTISYAAKVDFETGLDPNSVSLGDLDGDGKADLAVANNFSNTVSVLRNTSTTGMISYANKVDFDTGSFPFSICIGDLDGDGKADLAVANFGSNTVSAIRNNPLPPPPTINSFTPQSGQVGTAVTITGTGFNTTPANNIVIFGATAATVTAATINQLTVTVPIGATYAPITVLNTTTSLSAYTQSNFTPTFSPVKDTITDADFNPKVDFNAGVGPQSIAIGDLDGDGKADIVIGNALRTTVSVLRNTSILGTISYADKVEFEVGLSPFSVSIGDLDGDGKADLAVANYGGNTISILRNTGSTGIISYAAKVDFTTGTYPNSVSIGDLDENGKADLAVVNNNNVSVFLNNGTVGTISFHKLDFVNDSGANYGSIGDLDGDGKADLAVVNFLNNTVSIFRNTGGGYFAPRVDFNTGSAPNYISIGDLDGDGRADLAVANFGGSTVSVLRNTGSSGTISYAAKVDFATGSDPYSVAIGDLDGDGKADLALANVNSNTVSVLRNTGSTGIINYAAKVDFTTGTNPFSVSIGDLNGDGTADLAIVNKNSSTVSIIRNKSCITPAKPTVSVSGANTETPILTSSASAGNQWFKNGTLISGATNATLSVTEPGVYKVQVHGVEDCISEFSSDVAIIITGDLLNSASTVAIYPNPAREKLYIDLTSIAMGKIVELKIIDLLGRLIYKQIATGGTIEEVDFATCMNGSYILIVGQGKKSDQLKFVKK